tara:strand:- start:9327 stop:9551 length:225 start_codon:yes stop_codon:yes gene_type:complete
MVAMETKELSISEANEYLLGLFQALLKIDKFRDYIDDNYVIKQYIDDEGKVLQVEINLKDGNYETKPAASETVH